MFHTENIDTKKSLLILGAGVLLFSTYKVGKHISQYSSQMPDFIQNNANNCTHVDKQRIMDALEYNKRNFQFTLNELNQDMLKKLAYYTNSSFIHYSGNCTLLSTCLLFNLKYGRNILSAKNSSPFNVALSGSTSAQIVFGQKLTKSNQSFSTVSALEAEIINVFQNEGERFFKISSTGYTVPIMGECGHCLNAVVLGSGTSINVIYVDAWKTSNYLSSSQELQKRYPNGTFSLKYHKGPVNTLTPSTSNNYNNTT